ncbi:helix-turn-helix domain-containing protein [Cohnella sp. WQ 127256]|uniref:AraC family transcriptional regulator n=1 Tax=Cohnella sp. WQ 127256 TaxID=2938790 RepID=UPI002118C4F6|nr:helix-turn-helix domain-containing protein [Cohnella sp. WQ 127256]
MSIIRMWGIRSMKRIIPTGMENSLEWKAAPDVQAVIHVFAAHWRKVNSAWTYPEHTHPLFEFNVAWKGKQRMNVNGRPLVQEEGDILFIQPEVVHRSDGFVDGGEMAYFSLHFGIDDPSLRRSLLSIKESVIPANSAIATNLYEIFSHYMKLSDPQVNNGQGSMVLQESLLSLQASFRLFATLCEWVLSQEPALRNDHTEPTISIARAIERALNHSLNENRGVSEERTSIEQIAASLGYSPAYCNKVFKLVYGISPRQYLSDLTIREAKLLLMDQTLTIEDIAYRIGYREVSYFSKQFKRWTGISPLGYRRLSH